MNGKKKSTTKKKKNGKAVINFLGYYCKQTFIIKKKKRQVQGKRHSKGELTT